MEEKKIRLIVLDELTKNGTSLLKFREQLEDEVEIIKKDLKKYVNDMFQSGEFVDSFRAQLLRYIDQEVKSSLSESHLQEVVKDKIKYILKDRLKEIIDTVVKEIVTQTNKKLTKEYDIAKELSYSIESTIKHTLQKSPISYVNEGLIKEKIMGLLNKVKITDIKKLEDRR